MTLRQSLDVARQDLTSALRALRKSRGHTAVVVLTLGFGVGINATIFTVVHAVLLRPLAYPEPDRLVLIRETFPTLGLDRISVTVPEFLAYREEGRGRVFEEVAGFENGSVTLAEAGRAERLAATRVSADLLPLLRVTPFLGEPFSVDQERPGADRALLLSYDFWRRRFGAGRAVVGRMLRIDGTPYLVQGVLAPEFRFPHPGILNSEPADVLMPLAYTESERTGSPGSMNTHVLARLARGVGAERAREAASLTLERYRERTPGFASMPESVELVPLAGEVMGNVRGPLLLLMGAVGFVLLIASANVAHLTLVRLGNRRGELALRTALGASRSRLVRQLVTETVMTGAIGGAFGLGLAAAGVRILIALRPGDVPRLGESRVDLAVFGFALLVSVLTGALVGIFPALAAARTPPADALAGSRRAVGPGRGRKVGALVAAEVSLAIVLLVGAGLVIRSFVLVQRVETGADQGVLFARAFPAPATYPTGRRVTAFYATVLERLRHLPGVEAAALTSTTIVRDGWSAGYATEADIRNGQRTLRSARDAMMSPEYFRTLGVPVTRGRAFTDQDRDGAPLVVIVNQTMARLHWPGGDPIGQRLTWGNPNAPVWRTVVGVVADVKETGLDVATRPSMYFPFAQVTPDTTTMPFRSMVLVVRAGRDPADLIAAVRATVAGVDPTTGLDEVRTVRQIYAESLAPRRFNTLLLGAFGLAALALAALGLYGVMSEAVAARIPEIGVRMALGARSGDVLGMVVKQALLFTGAGVLAGAVLAIPLAGLVSRFLFGVGRLDPLTFTGVALVLVLAGIVAAYGPARRAARIDPASALRAE